MEPQKFDFIGTLLLASLFILLAYAGYLSYQSIDWQVLNKLENSPLLLPTPATSSANPAP